MTQVKQQPRGERQSLYSLGRDPSDLTFLIRKDQNLIHNDMEYRTHWDFMGNVEIWWKDPYFGDRWLDFLDDSD